MTAFAVRRDEESAPFFDAAARHELLIRRCERCGRAYPPYQHGCPDGGALAWTPAAGTGTLVTWAVEHGAVADPALAAAADTSVLSLVELAEGPWLYAALVDVDPATLREGAAVVVRFVQPGDGELVPTFTLA